jgi:hypothetical protein
MLRPMVSRPVCSCIRQPLGAMTRSYYCADIYGFVDMGRPLWRKDGSAIYRFHCPAFALNAKILRGLRTVLATLHRSISDNFCNGQYFCLHWRRTIELCHNLLHYSYCSEHFLSVVLKGAGHLGSIVAGPAKIIQLASCLSYFQSYNPK